MVPLELCGASKQHVFGYGLIGDYGEWTCASGCFHVSSQYAKRLKSLLLGVRFSAFTAIAGNVMNRACLYFCDKTAPEWTSNTNNAFFQG